MHVLAKMRGFQRFASDGASDGATNRLDSSTHRMMNARGFQEIPPAIMNAPSRDVSPTRSDDCGGELQPWPLDSPSSPDADIIHKIRYPDEQADEPAASSSADAGAESADAFHTAEDASNDEPPPTDRAAVAPDVPAPDGAGTAAAFTSTAAVQVIARLRHRAFKLQKPLLGTSRMHGSCLRSGASPQAVSQVREQRRQRGTRTHARF